MPPVFYCSYKCGAWLTSTPTLQMPDHITLGWVGQVLQTHWQPLYLGSLVLGILFALIGYFGTNAYWRWWVRRSWHKRQENRNQRNSQN